MAEAEQKAAPIQNPADKHVFTTAVSVIKLNPDGSPVLDARGERVIEKSVGTFTFKIATLRDRLRIGSRRIQYLGGNQPGAVDMETLLIAEYAATLPMVLIDVPHGWPKTLEDWEKRLDVLTEVDEPVLAAIYNAYREGVRTFRGGAEG